MKNFKNQMKSNQKGFTMIEILVALFLMTVIMAASFDFNRSTRDDLDNAITLVERATRFSDNESTLRRTMTRVTIDLDAEPQTLTVEYLNKDNFVLPSLEQLEESKKDEDEEKKFKSKISSNFTPVDEFEKSKENIKDNVKIIGVGSTLNQALVTEGQASFYFFQTGERESTIVFLGTEEEIASVIIEPFTGEILTEYTPLDEVGAPLEDLVETHIDKSLELYKDWLLK